MLAVFMTGIMYRTYRLDKSGAQVWRRLRARGRAGGVPQRNNAPRQRLVAFEA